MALKKHVKYFLEVIYIVCTSLPLSTEGLVSYQIFKKTSLKDFIFL